MTGAVRNPTHGRASRWVRRVYDDPQYRNTRWHHLVSAADEYVVTLCGRKLPRHTPAKSYNRLQFAEKIPHDDGFACLQCADFTGYL